jgi:VCBS repeat-containing protein
VSETCTGAVYNTEQYHSVVTQIDTQEAAKQLGEGYTLAGDVHSSISQATAKGHNRMDLAVKVTGTWVYQFSLEDRQQIIALVAGRSKSQALTLLEHVAGVQAVSLTIKNNAANLPTDRRNIHLVFLIMG